MAGLCLYRVKICLFVKFKRILVFFNGPISRLPEKFWLRIGVEFSNLLDLSTSGLAEARQYQSSILSLKLRCEFEKAGRNREINLGFISNVNNHASRYFWCERLRKQSSKFCLGAEEKLPF